MTKEQEATGKGAKFMDSFMPDWYTKIDLEWLSIDSCTDCILGQLYGDYEAGVEKIWGAQDNLKERIKLGFTSIENGNVMNLLTFYWKQEIQDRLSKEVKA